MSLADLAVDDVRCVKHAELVLHPAHNLIWGGNGSGKTSLLESIFLLGRGRSFRTRNSERLIRHGRDRLVVFGRTGAGAPHGFHESAGLGGSTAASASKDGTTSPGFSSSPTSGGGGPAVIWEGSASSSPVPPGLAAMPVQPTAAQVLGHALGVQVSRADGTTARISG